MKSSFSGILCILTLLCTDIAGAQMVRIPAGEFLMGSESGPADERPAHRLFLPAFEMDRLPVTNAEFADFLNAVGPANNRGENLFDVADPDARIHRRGGRWAADAGFESRPVVEASWAGARDYCAWLGKRLPTEAEWEKAARGEDGRINPWGNQHAGLSRANFGRTGLSGPVRDRPERLLLYPPIISVDKYENAVSPYGAHQMIGNVAEWVADWYDKDYYATAPDRNPRGPERGTQKAFRGGGWMDSTTTVRAAMRNGTDPTVKINWMGFRCARDAKKDMALLSPDARP